MEASAAIDPEETRRRVDAHSYWYHTLDVAPGVATNGWFDLRHVVDDLPWPDVKGKRCLDVGTFDGFYAFELERRGASEVIAIDIDSILQCDWPPDHRAELPGDPQTSVPPGGTGFRLAADLLGSSVAWRPLSIYDLDPALVGTFDVVVLGSLLLHLRDPLRALEAVRSVVAPDGWFLSVEQIEVWMTLGAPRRPLYTLRGSGPDCQWFNSNAAGHHRMLYAAGFEVAGRSRPFVACFNRHPRPPLRSTRQLLRRAAFRGLTGSWRDGVLHRALLARRRV